ncbi:HNH endonuclease [Pantoea sp. ACRSB]|uniref:HNH endonuclease n=1 Tax=Pantoea sp. ACRSB TaxID=2918207 RepID=UPI00289330E3|nr:HNH endonuclease [Pantoea sp. ACRSB]MCG7388320.1 HNH endonuclease [Pantoea sp. ACRSB]
MSDITADELKRLFEYNPDTGVFIRRKSLGPCAAGAIVRTKALNGYLSVMVNGKGYLLHRLAWLITTGGWPIGQIDHVDGNRSNNAISNLRDASGSQNQYNKKRQGNNTSGFKGVSYHKKTRRFRASINVNGKQISLGYFDTAQRAHQAYVDKAREIAGGFANAG